jgi:hypothetical protein
LELCPNSVFASQNKDTIVVTAEEIQAVQALKLSYALKENKTIDFLGDYLHDERGLSGLPDHSTPLSRKESHNTILRLKTKKQDYGFRATHLTARP